MAGAAQNGYKYENIAACMLEDTEATSSKDRWPGEGDDTQLKVRRRTPAQVCTGRVLKCGWPDQRGILENRQAFMCWIFNSGGLRSPPRADT
eukprot:1143951-Pelagomonas_calceolata.AAC.3